MTVIIISIIVFLIMLLFPVLFSVFFLRKKGGEVLRIERSKVKDPRYFVKSFTKIFDENWTGYDGKGKLKLSREENIIEADKSPEYPNVCNSIIYAESLEFRPRPGIRFEKEVYTRQNAYLSGIESVRAICSRKDMVLGKGTKVLRWADAEGILYVSDDCDLGISASSTTKILIGSNCSFRRLYAPIIVFGQASVAAEQLKSLDENINIGSEIKNRYWNIKYADDDLGDDNGIFKGSIITKYDFSLLNSLTVEGHIRSHRNIRICDGGIVYGNLFADGDIYIGQNARIYGSVFTQGSFYAESGTIIGQPGKVKSVIARGRIIFEKNCCVYGYISSETGGGYSLHQKTAAPKKPRGQILPDLVSGEDYLQKKTLPALISAALVFIVLAAGISAAALSLKVQEKDIQFAAKQTPPSEIYGTDGKPGGGSLETKPVLVTYDHVYFKDRVLERFHYNSEDINRFSGTLKELMASLPERVNKSLMLIPMRISLEGEEYKQYTDDTFIAISQIYGEMPPNVKRINASEALLRHRNEYLYFRTDFSWTPLGARYAAEEYCRDAGILPKSLVEYHMERSGGYHGNFSYLPNAESIDSYPDFVDYYLLDGAVNEEIITAYRSRGVYMSYRSPAVAVSRRGSNIYVGSLFSHSILSGDGKNGRTLMITGDEYGKTLAPWLTPYYEHVVLINLKFFSGGFKKFNQLLTDYKVTDFLAVGYAKSIENDTINDKLEAIYSKP